jgi:putative ABC transport system substrate-binding protein
LSLNRPGGNLTGITGLAGEIAEKRLELLHQAAPGAETIGLLVAVGLRLLVFNVTADSEITPVFATLVEQQAGVVLIGASTILVAKRDQIVSACGLLCASHHVFRQL